MLVNGAKCAVIIEGNRVADSGERGQGLVNSIYTRAHVCMIVWQRNYDCRARDLLLHFPLQAERNVAILPADLFDRWLDGEEKSVLRFKERSLSLSANTRRTWVRGAEIREKRGGKKKKNDPSIHPSIQPSEERKQREERGKREEKGRCARVALIRPSASLSPSSCTVPVEYRLSVVRLGVLRSSKYLGIFEEPRVPKKTVYFVGKEGSFPGEAEQAETGAVFY